MKNEKMLKVRELMKEWEKINEEIKQLNVELKGEKINFPLFQGFGSSSWMDHCQ